MSQKVTGNLRGLSPSQIRSVEKLYRRSVEADELVSLALGREIHAVAKEIGRRIGVLISREGKVEMVFVGSREILYLPDLGRYRLGAARLRRLRLVFSDLSKEDREPQLPSDILTDLEKLRLDAVIGVKNVRNHLAVAYAHLIAISVPTDTPVRQEIVKNFVGDVVPFRELISSVEDELERADGAFVDVSNGAVLVGVYPKQTTRWQESLLELRELAKTAGVTVVDEVIQRRSPDPRTLVGKGKLEEIVLLSLRVGAELLIFDGELQPHQWRVITNSTELKVVDRSMLILDIFSQRAKSSDGRLQVELAQLQYNLPRLVEKDVGLSRLTGGIGGRGPGETKLEISRRRARDRIRDLEKRIEKLRNQRQLRRQKRQGIPVPLVAILGYTNAGKSTLFNTLTSGSVLAEDKLFATLEPSQGRYVLPPVIPSDLNGEEQSDEHNEPHQSYGTPIVFTDTVGFIRDLPDELRNAFRATLEELYEANVLLHVVDASSPFAEEQVLAVESVLKEMELEETPAVLVWNKVDAVQKDDLERLMAFRKGVPVSAIQKTGFSEMLTALSEEISSLDLKKESEVHHHQVTE